MRKASLGTIFLTVLLDLLGFGLVVPYLPEVARAHGASDFVATLLGASYSLMQLLFVPFWGHLSDRVGRRPLLVWSIAATVVGNVLLGSASSLWMLFAARIWCGIATSNLAVAQAYIADVTRPEDRAKGMGLIGAGIGIGFVFGPVIGGLLEGYSPLARAGALPAFAAAGLSFVNLLLAVSFLPESLSAARRGRSVRPTPPPAAERFRAALVVPGIAVALALHFVAVLSFSALEQTFRLFTADEFAMTVRATGYVLGFMGVILILVQGGLLRALARVWSERVLVRIGLAIQALGFVLFAGTPRLGGSGLAVLYLATALIAFGSALTNPSLSAFVSRCAEGRDQGAVLGVLQSAGALARVCGPAAGGLLYQNVGHSAPYFAASVGMAFAGAVSLCLSSPPPVQPSPAAACPARRTQPG